MSVISLPSVLRTPQPALRWMACLWLAVGIAVTIRTLARPARHTVFPVLATGSQHWWGDVDLYADYKPLDYYRYPPIFAVALTPLAVLGLAAGGIGWSWLSLAVYGAGLWSFLRSVMPGRWPVQRQALFLGLALLGGLRGLWNAQANALVVGLLLLAAAAIARERWGRAAALLAGAVLIKLTPLAVALLFCALWPRQLAGRFLLCLLGGLLLPFLTRPPGVVLEQYHSWVVHLFGMAHERWPGFRDGWTLWQIVEHHALRRIGPLPLRDPIDTPVYRGVQLLSALAVLLWCLGLRRRGLSRRWQLTLTLALGQAWLMLLGPAVEHATHVFLAPLVIWAWLEPELCPRGRGLLATALVMLLLLGWGALARPVQDDLPAVLAVLPLGTLLFLVWLVRHGIPPGACRAVTPRAAYQP